MFSKEQVKEFIVLYGKKILFPDFSNKLSWGCFTLGVGLLLSKSPLTLVFINWVITAFNINNGNGYTLPEFQDGSPAYGYGVFFVLFAVFHNLIYRIICYKEARNKYLDELPKVESDRELFSSFITMLPSSSEAVTLLEKQHFGSSYRYGATDAIEQFVQYWGSAEKVFHDSELEGKKSKLYNKCSEFMNEVYTNAGPIGNGSRVSFISPGIDDFNIPQYILDNVRNANAIASDCYSLHQDFVLSCRKKLSC